MDKKIRLVLDRWTYRDYISFANAMNEGDSRKSYALAEQLIVSWDYDIPLDSDNPIGKLSVAEGARVVRTVLDTLNDFVENISIEDVTVNFDKWTTARFLEFDDARRNQQVRKVEAMLFEIASMPGASSDEPLSFVHGSAMIKAVNEAYKRLISGKN